MLELAEGAGYEGLLREENGQAVLPEMKVVDGKIVFADTNQQLKPAAGEEIEMETKPGPDGTTTYSFKRVKLTDKLDTKTGEVMMDKKTGKPLQNRELIPDSLLRVTVDETGVAQNVFLEAPEFANYAGPQLENLRSAVARPKSGSDPLLNEQLEESFGEGQSGDSMWLPLGGSEGETEEHETPAPVVGPLPAPAGGSDTGYQPQIDAPALPSGLTPGEKRDIIDAAADWVHKMEEYDRQLQENRAEELESSKVTLPQPVGQGAQK